jgi:predicted hotdog family 3-hydroxylacyl-ACP dehydratase
VKQSDTMSDSPPTTLDHAAIARRIPHAGTMCLLERLDAWTPADIHCTATGHAAADHPLRSASGLLACNAIEVAAQAMALHGSLVAAPGTAPSPGYIASVRGVRLSALRLDEVAGALKVHATRLAGGANEVLYAFAVRDERGAALAEGRAAVVLDTPIATTASEGAP